MNKQQKHEEGSEEQKKKQIFRSGPNEGNKIQNKEESDEERSTQQQSINTMLIAMESLQKGLEQLLLQTKSH